VEFLNYIIFGDGICAAPQQEEEGDGSCRHLLLLCCSAAKQEEEEGGRLLSLCCAILQHSFFTMLRYVATYLVEMRCKAQCILWSCAAAQLHKTNKQNKEEKKK
jgi:hypothetical protein